MSFLDSIGQNNSAAPNTYGSGGPSPSDAVTQLAGIARNLAHQTQALFRSNALTVSNWTGVNNLGTAVATVLAAAQSSGTTTPRVTGILFHNPMTQTAVMVSPSTVNATFGSPGGGLVILPQDYLPLAGNVTNAWVACVQAGTTGALTIVTSTY